MAPQLEFKLETSCPAGFTKADLERLFNSQELKKFYKWMTGQTCMLCNGKRYNHKLKRYEATECSGMPDGTPLMDSGEATHGHGVITYRWDVERYIEGGYAKAIFD